MSGVLHVVATPIGNLGDMSTRARETLATVDLVVAEDTRRTGKLLATLGIDARMRSMFEGNERRRTDEVLAELRDGRSVALVSDGGTPLVSDPGFLLVRACIDEGIDVRVVPGPSAVVAALVVSGLPTDRFVFEGFLPRTAGGRRVRLAEIVDEPRTVVLYESPRRLPALLDALEAAIGERRVAVCRELTKLHEEVLRGTPRAVRAAIGDAQVRGEVVVVVEGRPSEAPPDVDAAIAEARDLVADGTRKREAAHRVAERTGVSVNAIYRALVPDSATEGLG
jgi:16S rRNA (cytidine1402-2'-O)-methyltransferase